MARTFRNPANGHDVEVGGLSVFWTAIFGAFYLMFKGLWPHVLIWFLLVIGSAVIDDGFGFLVWLGVTIGYMFGIQSLLAARYLDRGWTEVGENRPYYPNKLPPMQFGDRPTATPATKKCPFCAEEILAEAKRCKHCRSDI